MGREEAERVVDAMPQVGTTDQATFARYMEARMVAAGDPPERIKAALEKYLGRQLG